MCDRRIRLSDTEETSELCCLFLHSCVHLCDRLAEPARGGMPRLLTLHPPAVQNRCDPPLLSSGAISPFLERRVDAALGGHLMKAASDPKPRSFCVGVLVGDVGGELGVGRRRRDSPRTSTARMCDRVGARDCAASNLRGSRCRTDSRSVGACLVCA